MAGVDEAQVKLLVLSINISMSPERKRVRASSIRPREGALTLFSHPFFLNAKKQDMKHIFHFSIGFISQRPNSCSREGLSGVEIVCFKVSTFDRASGILEDSFELRSKLFCSFSFSRQESANDTPCSGRPRKHSAVSLHASLCYFSFQLFTRLPPAAADPQGIEP